MKSLVQYINESRDNDLIKAIKSSLKVDYPLSVQDVRSIMATEFGSKNNTDTNDGGYEIVSGVVEWEGDKYDFEIKGKYNKNDELKIKNVWCQKA